MNLSPKFEKFIIFLNLLKLNEIKEMGYVPTNYVFNEQNDRKARILNETAKSKVLSC